MIVRGSLEDSVPPPEINLASCISLSCFVFLFELIFEIDVGSTFLFAGRSFGLHFASDLLYLFCLLFGRLLFRLSGGLGGQLSEIYRKWTPQEGPHNFMPIIVFFVTFRLSGSDGLLDPSGIDFSSILDPSGTDCSSIVESFLTDFVMIF